MSETTRSILTKFSGHGCGCTCVHGSTCGCRCSIWNVFRSRSTGVAMTTNFRRHVGKVGEKAFLLGTRILQRMAGWESGWTH